uniref:PKD_channel domain-containing protein n=1 Tax=Angiostrongylus cantonensis TaxID=6313 RepID=A0A0K0CZ73_ANGCA
MLDTLRMRKWETCDFHSYLDPTYGACFTYVGNQSANLVSERSGPAYGLRLELFVNITEYLPTTEAAGVRLTVHSFEEQPFPDTLGHSAPTGFVSSFGIRMVYLCCITVF